MQSATSSSWGRDQPACPAPTSCPSTPRSRWPSSSRVWLLVAAPGSAASSSPPWWCVSHASMHPPMLSPSNTMHPPHGECQPFPLVSISTCKCALRCLLPISPSAPSRFPIRNGAALTSSAQPPPIFLFAHYMARRPIQDENLKNMIACTEWSVNAVSADKLSCPAVLQLFLTYRNLNACESGV